MPDDRSKSRTGVEDGETTKLPLYAHGGERSLSFAEPTLARRPSDRAASSPSTRDDRERIGFQQTLQGGYAAASGTLTQFNAILAAVLGVVLTTEAGLVKVAVAVALLGHVAAAFILCWAARPVDLGRADSAEMALANSIYLVDDSFRNYRWGWRFTIAALSLSALAFALVLLSSLAGQLPGTLDKLF